METASLRVGFVIDSLRCYRRSQLRHTKSMCKNLALPPEIVLVLLRLAGIRVEGKKIPDSLAEILESIYNNSVSTAASALMPTSERLQHSKASDNIRAWDEEVSALATDETKLDWSHTTLELLMVYDIWIWLLFALVLVITKCYTRAHRWLMVCFFGNTNSAPHKSYSAHNLVVGYFMMLFGGLYSNGILAALLTQKRVQSFNTFEEMISIIEAGKLRVVGDSLASSVWSRDLKSVRRVKNIVENNKQSAIWINGFMYTTGTAAVDKMIVNGEAVMIGIDEFIIKHHARLCGTRMVRLPEMGAIRNGLLFATNVSDQVIKRVNAAIHEAHAGLMIIAEQYKRRKKKEASEASYRCSHGGNQPFNGLSKIGIYNAFGNFAFLGAGMTIALVTLGLEWHWRWNRIFWF